MDDRSLGSRYIDLSKLDADRQRSKEQRLVHVLVVDADASHRFGKVRAWQLDNGLGSPELDLLNGAVALVHDLTMVTHNQADYDNIPGPET
jgi:predicted nucleic acid-binding protein